MKGKDKYVVVKGRKPERCELCNKILRKNNKTGLCCACYEKQKNYNHYHKRVKGAEVHED